MDVSPHIGLVGYTVKPFWRNGGAREPLMDSDEFGDGCLALTNAGIKYDPRNGLAFSSWAIRLIRQAMIKRIIDGNRKKRHGRTVSIGRQHDRGYVAKNIDKDLAGIAMSLCNENEIKLLRNIFWDQMTMEEIGKARTPPVTRAAISFQFVKIVKMLREALEEYG